jgi:hypothetical protein
MTGSPAAARSCMRWAPGRTQTWRRPEDGGFDASRYAVAPISEPAARQFVTARHYAGDSWPSARLRYGLFDTAAGRNLVGAAVLGIPVAGAVLTGVFPGLAPYEESLELSRFVLSEQVPSNGETWFLARAFALAAADGIQGVVSFADPVPRLREDGTQVKPGHVGLIYAASGAIYTGRGTPRTLKLLRDGTVLSERALQKVRRQERGHEYVERLLVAHGARPPRAGQAPAAWLAEALDSAGIRRLRHQGNHRYAFRLGLSRRARAAVPVALPALPRPRKPDPCPPDELDLGLARLHA